MSRSVDESGNTAMKTARLAVWSAPELGTQVNGVTVRSGPLADPHLPI